jgi:hypothetical protein
MKRDMELIRDLLLSIESRDDDDYDYYSCTLKLTTAQSPEKVKGHLLLLIDAKLIDAKPMTNGGLDEVYIKRMLWAGHEFLDSTKDESIWKDVKDIVAKKGLSMESISFGVLTQLLASVVKQHLNLN